GALQHKLDVLAAHCRDVGRDPADSRKQLVVQMVLGEDESEVDERARRLAAARRVEVDQLRATAIIGTPDEAVERLLRYVRMGVGDFLIGARAPADLRTLEIVANKVAPIVKAEAAGVTAR